MWYTQTSPQTPINWSISDYDYSKQEQIFIATKPGKDCDLIIILAEGIHTVEIYENIASSPTRTKTIVY